MTMFSDLPCCDLDRVFTAFFVHLSYRVGGAIAIWCVQAIVDVALRGE